MFSQKNKQGWRNPWVFGLLIIVLSGVLINGRMIWNVIQHPMRLLDDHYNVKAHNQYDAKWVQQQAERSTLGWHAKLHSPQRLENDSEALLDTQQFILIANPADIKFELSDRDGKPVKGGSVEINAQWPGDSHFDFKTKLYEGTPGIYTGSMKFNRAGNWDLQIRVLMDDREFDKEQKVFVAIPK
jgi:nitrogen fixation protein FixH